MRGRRDIYTALVVASVVLSTPVVQAQVMLKPVFHRLVSVGAWQQAVPEAELLMPKAVVTDADGRIYVADTGDFTVKVFDRQGEFIRAIGREGSGPGEFLDIESLSVDQRGNLLVADVRNRRITRFSPDGEVLA